MMAATGLELIRGVLIDPLSNPTATFVLIAIVSMTVLLALSLLMMALIRPPGQGDEDWLDEEHETADADALDSADYGCPDLVPDEVVADPPVRHDETDDLDSGERRDRHRRRLGCSAIVAIVAVVLLIAGTAVTSTDAYCSRVCHAHCTAVAARAHDAHAGRSCVACHEDASLAGSIGAPLDRMGHALRRAWAGGGSKMAPVSSRSCLGCHRDIASHTVSLKDRGVRISHRAPLAAGMSCGDCHLGTGHSSGRARPVGMRACSVCHNGRVAPATCATCHTQDPRSTPRPSPASLTYHAVPLGRSADCVTCHDGH